MPRLKAPQRREQLIAVASRLFAKRGYEATTTAAIAEAAGVTEPILYRHFKNKQELFVAIVRKLSQQTLQHWQDLIADTTDPAEQIRRIGTEYPAHMHRLADAYQVIQGALATSTDRKVLAVISEHYTQVQDAFTRIITEGQKAGIFRRDLDPRVSAWTILSMGLGYTMISLNLPRFGSVPVTEMVDFTLKAMGNC